jgi:hypothetical protein
MAGMVGVCELALGRLPGVLSCPPREGTRAEKVRRAAGTIHE